MSTDLLLNLPKLPLDEPTGTKTAWFYKKCTIVTDPCEIRVEGFFPGEARRNDPMVKSWRSPKELAGILSETFIMGLAGLLKAGWRNAFIYLLEEPILSFNGGTFINL